MLEFRYHIVSLIAVLLSLGIGIVIGSTLLPSALMEKQTQMVKKLERDFAEIRKETKKVEGRLKLSDTFEKNVLPLVIHSKLNGKNIAIIETNEQSNDLVQNILIGILKQAGANIQNVTSISEGFGFENKELKQAVTSHLGLQNHTMNKILQNISSRLAKEIVQGGDIPLLSYLQEKRVIQPSGDYSNPSYTVVIVGGSNKKNNNVNFYIKNMDVFIINTLKEMGVRVIGVEKKDVEISFIPTYEKLGISTIDNVDEVSGQISLVLVLSGREGNYGIKKNARQLLPRIIPEGKL
jgi:5-enolpyruvylshikimate-3-phosphate synthase